MSDRRLGPVAKLSTILLFLVISSACVPIPVGVDPEIKEIVSVDASAGLRVTVGPRRLLAAIAGMIEKENDAIEVVDPLAFRDTAFPKGGWYLEDLLANEHSTNVAESLGVLYLVLVQDLGYKYTENRSIMAPFAFGGLSYSDRSELAALVVDLQSGEPVAYFAIVARGEGRGGFLFIYGAFKLPMTERGAKSGVAEAIADVVTRDRGDAGVRIAVLAGEIDTEPFSLITSPAAESE